MIRWTPFLLLWTPLSSMYFGNPAQPALQTEGIAFGETKWVSLRVGYLDDYLYNQRYEDEFKLESLINSPTFVELATHAAEITLNVKNWIDVYGLLGESQIQVDRDVYANWQFAWGVGAKVVFFEKNQFRVGGDFKYFESNQEPLYLISENLPYNIVGQFDFHYEELQGALGISYQIDWLCPYIAGTYLFSRISPDPTIFLVRLPNEDLLTDITSKSVVSEQRWGLALGVSILGGKQGSLSLETRMFNQNGVDISGEIRF